MERGHTFDGVPGEREDLAFGGGGANCRRSSLGGLGESGCSLMAAAHRRQLSGIAEGYDNGVDSRARPPPPPLLPHAQPAHSRATSVATQRFHSATSELPAHSENSWWGACGAAAGADKVAIHPHQAASPPRPRIPAVPRDRRLSDASDMVRLGESCYTAAAAPPPPPPPLQRSDAAGAAPMAAQLPPTNLKGANTPASAQPGPHQTSDCGAAAPTAAASPASAATPPVPPPPALAAAQPRRASDPQTGPMGAGVCSARTSPAVSPSRSLRRSRSLGSRSTAQRQTPAAGGAPAGGGLPGPVPKFSSEVTFQPLGHQGSKWCVPAPPPATPASAATVAAVDVLSQSTTAALTRERRQEAPAGAGGDRRQQPPPAWASSVASDPSDGIFHAMPACAASQLPAHRPWTGVRRVIEEVGRQAGIADDARCYIGAGSGACPAAAPAPAQACQAAAAPGVSLTSTSALPWDVPAAAVGGVWRRGPSQRTAEGTDPRAGRPPRPPGPPSAALLRPTRAEPSPPYKARVWHAQSTENFSPLFTSAASESLRRRQGEPAAAEATISPPASPPAASSARLAVLRRLLPHRRR